MEAATKELISGTDYGGGVREEKRYESTTGCEEGWKKETTTIFEVRNWRPCLENYLKPASSPLQKDSSSCSKQDLQLQSTRAKMIEAREENERLTKYFDRILKDYHNLQMKFFDIVKKDGRKTTDNTNGHHQIEETGTFLSLHLGSVPPRETNDQKKRIVVSSQLKEDNQAKEVLSLGLDCRSFELFKSKVVVSRFEELKEEARETSWLPSKVLKTMRSGDDEFQRQNYVKKARVSVRARCDTPTMIDGCQWRKYGQKTAKGHPCPRAYYRCNVSPSCPVRKQVQRCAEDISILITTYEGTHNHQLPMSATFMASTTSAAASMLLSDSSGSQHGHSSPATTITSSPTANLHGLNFSKTDNLQSKHFYLSNSSFSSSSIPSHPTITLDLTSSPSSSLPNFNKVSSEYCPSYSSSSLNFKSSNFDAISWANNGFFNDGHQSYNKNQIGSQSMRRQPVEDIYQSYTQRS